MPTVKRFGVLLSLVVILASLSTPTRGAARRGDVERALKQRYRLTLIGTSMLGFSGSRSSVREAGGVLALRRAGLAGAFDPDRPATFHIRDGQAAFASALARPCSHESPRLIDLHSFPLPDCGGPGRLTPDN